MLFKVSAVATVLALAGCTNVKVEPIDLKYQISNVCIEENPKVVVGDFVDGLQTLLRKHRIESRLYTSPVPASCEYRLKYTATRSWDLKFYLSDASVSLYQYDTKIGDARYHLTGEGGFDLSKWGTIEEKMGPVIDQLLGQKK